MTTEIIIKTDSRFIHGEELQKLGKYVEIPLVVKSVAAKDTAKTLPRIKGKPDTAIAIKGYPVAFEKTDRILVLNVTNTKLARAAFETNDTAQWLGRNMVLYARMLEDVLGQPNIICVRIRVPAGLPVPFIHPRHMGKDLTK